MLKRLVVVDLGLFYFLLSFSEFEEFICIMLFWFFLLSFPNTLCVSFVAIILLRGIKQYTLESVLDSFVRSVCFRKFNVNVLNSVEFLIDLRDCHLYCHIIYDEFYR